MNNLFTDFVLEAVPDGLSDIAEGFRNCWTELTRHQAKIEWSKTNSTIELVFAPLEDKKVVPERMAALHFLVLWNEHRTRGNPSAYAKVKIRKDDTLIETFIRPLMVAKPAGALHGGNVLFAYNDW